MGGPSPGRIGPSIVMFRIMDLTAKLDRMRRLTLGEGFFARPPALGALRVSDLSRDVLLLAPRGECAYVTSVIGE